MSNLTSETPSRYPKKDTVRGTFLDEAEYREKLHKMQEIIQQTIVEFEQEHLELYNQSSDIVGVVIYGSWANGNPHTKSDVDMYVITTTDTVSLWMEFTERLGSNRLFGVSAFGPIDITQTAEVKKTFLDPESLIVTSGYLIVSPYDWVESQIKNCLG